MLTGPTRVAASAFCQFYRQVPASGTRSAYFLNLVPAALLLFVPYRLHISHMASTTAAAADPLPNQPPKKEPITKDSITLRSYQTRIVAKALKANSIVVLPTGAGKTLIAAELILQYGTPALFLVPTVMLVEQQEAALRNWTQLDVKPYCGGTRLPTSFEVLVSTPKAFEAAQEIFHNEHLQWDMMKTIVFDEVHHVLKEHPYRKLAFSLHRNAARPRVLGLTASYTYAIGEKETKSALQRMCNELRVTNLETASFEELRTGGYHAAEIKPEIPHAEMKHEVPEGVLPVEDRRPHLMMRTFFDRVLAGEATAFAHLLTKCVLQLEVVMTGLDPTFIPSVQSGHALRQWSTTAHRHAGLTTGNNRVLFQQMEQWYEALRQLVVSWEEGEYASVLFLRMFKCDTEAMIRLWPRPAGNVITHFWQRVPTKFARLDNLKTVLIDKHRRMDSFRGILFVQQRASTHILEYFIGSDPELSALFHTTCLYAASSPATPSLNITRAQGRIRMQQFSSGAVNLLITTVVAEEGKLVRSLIPLLVVCLPSTNFAMQLKLVFIQY